MILPAATGLSVGLIVRIAPAANYLSESGRAEVDALKVAYHESPTSRATYPERAAVAWRWLGTLAMVGCPLPVNIIIGVRPVLPDPARPRQLSNLDYYIRELTLLDGQPRALGKLSATMGPHTARSLLTVHQRRALGSRAVVQGGGLLVAAHFMPGNGCFQAHNPVGNNYVAIASNRQEVVFVADGFPRLGMHGGFRGARPALFFRLAKGLLEPGDTVTLIYGDCSAGGGGWRKGAGVTDFLPVPEGHCYMRERLVKDAVAWSSPTWVGGFAPR
jgi:hypothetical protein